MQIQQETQMEKVLSSMVQNTHIMLKISPATDSARYFLGTNRNIV